MRKIIAAVVNAIALVLMLSGIAVLTGEALGGDALSHIRQPDYVKSAAFETRVTESVNDLFEYIELKELFERADKLNLNQVIVQGEADGKPVSYSLDQLIRYARSMGYYLNERNIIMSDGPVTVTRAQDETEHQMRVTYRAYLPEYTPASPADGMTTLGKVARETLDYLAKYYSTRGAYFDRPGNFLFSLAYYRNPADLPLDNADGRDTDGAAYGTTASGGAAAERPAENGVSGRTDTAGFITATTPRSDVTSYGNAGALTTSELARYGCYIETSSEDMAIHTNLRVPPGNLTPLLEAHNPYEGGAYRLVVGIDTGFPADDAYRQDMLRYESLRASAVVGIVLLLLGLLTVLGSFAALLAFTGHTAGDRKIRLYALDALPVELMAVLCVLWYFAAEAITPVLLESIENLIGRLPRWEFWYETTTFLLKYLLYAPICLAIVRNYKGDTLYRHSLLRRIELFVRHYVEAASETYPRIFSYVLFLIPNACGVLLIGALFTHFFRERSLRAFLTAIAVLLILIAIDFYTFRIATGLSKAVDEQVRSERLKADLITNVSHDLKTPLTSIINYVDLLKREQIDNPRVQEYLRVLEQKSTRLKTLTEDLVEASKASSGNVTMEFADIDYCEILQQAVGEFEDKFLLSRLEVKEDIPGEPVMIRADGRRLWRVLENLLNNCCKYALRGSRVYIELTVEEETAACTIKNISQAPLNISPEELTERFVRGDVSRTTEGSGLGLSIAKSLTTLMHGELRITIDGDLYKASVVLPRVTMTEDTEASAGS